MLTQKKKKALRHFLAFNLLLISLVMIFFRIKSDADYIILLSNKFIFWSGAVKHMIFLGGLWIFIDVLFMLWYFYPGKISKYFKR